MTRPKTRRDQEALDDCREFLESIGAGTTTDGATADQPSEERAADLRQRAIERGAGR